MGTYNPDHDLSSITGIEQFSADKRAERERLLDGHPELRIRIDTAGLRKIIDYVSFRCARNCSVAYDTAIRGSDIDGGVVVTQQPEPTPKRLEFIAELRRQGFEVYDVAELAEEIKYETALMEYKGGDMKQLMRIIRSWSGDTHLANILKFVTLADIAQFEQEPKPPIDPYKNSEFLIPNYPAYRKKTVKEYSEGIEIEEAQRSFGHTR